MKSADKIIKQNLPTTYGDDGIVLAKYAPNQIMKKECMERLFKSLRRLGK